MREIRSSGSVGGGHPAQLNAWQVPPIPKKDKSNKKKGKRNKSQSVLIQGLTVQPTKLPGKQVKVLPGQFPFWLCSYIRHQGRVTYLMKARK